MQNWYLLYSSRNLPEASIIKGMLEENSVPVMIVNKQPSTYLGFGDVEVYVPNHFKDTAKQLIDRGLSS